MVEPEPSNWFPPPYQGAFERHSLSATIALPGWALSQSGRDMLELRLGPQAAGRLIDCIERMAAAAARVDYDT
jgi:hypothetical protein